MKTSQLNITAGMKIPYAYGGHVRYEVTEVVDLDPEDNRDQVLREKRNELTTHVYQHAMKMLNRLDADMIARAEAKK